ncbi:MAG: hypothetical protein N3B10_05835 [Armatimonadetes bacterium]|nr:hypothetical protein [Armatimonadota bacterium]MCX7967998.1 hypothetical protein [Armatimonadota bacterium]MDW8142045.1 hypothetical protein [Armatimonadota bacterium]
MGLSDLVSEGQFYLFIAGVLVFTSLIFPALLCEFKQMSPFAKSSSAKLTSLTDCLKVCD